MQYYHLKKKTKTQNGNSYTIIYMQIFFLFFSLGNFTGESAECKSQHVAFLFLFDHSLLFAVPCF